MKNLQENVKDMQGIQKKKNHAVSVNIPQEDYDYLTNVAKKRRGQSVSCLIREIIGKAIDDGFGE